MVRNQQGRFKNDQNFSSAIEPTADPSEAKTTEDLGQKPAEVVLIEDHRLYKLESKTPFLKYLRLIWSRRQFIVTQARTTAFSTGRDRYLGNLWVILDPIFQVAIYALVFGLILNTSRGMDNFIGFLVIGVIYFGFASSGFSAGSGLIKSSRGLIASFNFPRVAIVFSTTLKLSLNNAVPAVLAIAVALLFQIDKPVSWTIILTVPLFLLIQIFTFGITCIVARATAFIPDLQSLVSLIRRGLFFLSGVFFSISRFDTHPVVQSIVEINPIYQFLMAVRDCVLEGTVPALPVWIYLISVSFGLAIFGLIYFWRVEERYATLK